MDQHVTNEREVLTVKDFTKGVQEVLSDVYLSARCDSPRSVMVRTTTGYIFKLTANMVRSPEDSLTATPKKTTDYDPDCPDERCSMGIIMTGNDSMSMGGDPCDHCREWTQA